MKKIWNKWLKEAIFIYCAIYTLATIVNSILFLATGTRNDPSGNWHEIDRALIVLIGVLAFELAKHLPIRNILFKATVIYIPTMLLVFLTVWSSHFIEPLAKTAYRDIFVNYTGMFIIVSAIACVKIKINKIKINKIKKS